MSRIRDFYSRTTPALVLFVVILACVLIAAVEPRFASMQNILNILIQASPLVLVALAQAIIITSGGLDLSQGAVVALAAVIGITIGIETNTAWLGWLAVLGTSVLLGALNGALVGWMRVPSFIATMGMLTYADGLAFLFTGGLPVEFPPAGYSWFGRAFVWRIPVAIPTVAILALATCYIMHRTRVGRGIYLVGDNDQAARIAGINPSLYRFYAFCMGGLLTGCAAILLTGRIDSAPPSLAPDLQFEAIAAVAVGGIAMSGGKGGIWRALVGVAPVAITVNFLNLMGIQTGVQLIVIGAITVIVVAMQYVTFQTGKQK